MEQKPDGNYCLILTPEQTAALKQILFKILPLGNIEAMLANISPEDRAQLYVPCCPPFGGGNETDES